MAVAPEMMMPAICVTNSLDTPNDHKSGVTNPMIAAQNLRLLSLRFQSMFMKTPPFFTVYVLTSGEYAGILV